MRDPKGVVGRAGGEARDGESGAGKTRGLDVRFASGADAAVSRRLKEMYDGLVSEPVPDRFLDLLNQLDQVEKPAGSGSAPSGGGAPDTGAESPSSQGPVPGKKP
jgi:hypothetical protein